MALDPNPTSATTVVPAASAIDNEIPAYRAIAPRAVVALVLGVASILSFVSWYFLPLAALAILVGYTADRKIQRYADLYTGRGMAQAGLGLGLLFGLAALTIGGVQSWALSRQASGFGRGYADVLSKGSFEQIVWWGQQPVSRREKTPEKVFADLTTSPSAALHFEEEFGSIRKLKKQLDTPGTSLHFERLENYGVDGLNPWGSALYVVEGPEVKEGEQYAAALYKGVKDQKGVWEWWVEKVKYPAAPGGIGAPAPKPSDDGHGHGHGH